MLDLKLCILKVEETLHSALEQHVEDAASDQQRWVSALTEKLPWCADITGDKYSIEAKLATVTELLAGVDVGEKKADVLAEKVELLKAVNPARRQELEQRKRDGLDGVRGATETLLQTK